MATSKFSYATATASRMAETQEVASIEKVSSDKTVTAGGEVSNSDDRIVINQRHPEILKGASRKD